MKTLFDDAEHWWSRAEETRTIAEIMTDPEAKRTSGGARRRAHRQARDGYTAV